MNETKVLQPNVRTYVAALMAVVSLCNGEEAGTTTKIDCLEAGMRIHHQATEKCSDSETDLFLKSTLVDMYASCGSMLDARMVFDRMPRYNVVCWTNLIAGYSQSREAELALELFSRMTESGCYPNSRCYVAGLLACVSLVERDKDCEQVRLASLERAMGIHREVAAGELDVFLANTLIDLYSKCGSMVDARSVFDRMAEHNLVSLHSLMLGYVMSKESGITLELFQEISSSSSFQLNSLSFSNALMACGELVNLQAVKEVHRQVCRLGHETDAAAVNALVDVYGKCGSMVVSQLVFDSARLKAGSVAAWNGLISGYSRAGDAQQVFELFARLEEEGLEADEIAFMALLWVCSHSGLVDKGKEYFRRMCLPSSGVKPGIEHYTCVIDMLGRKNRVEEAVAMMRELPMRADAASWTSVLAACRKWRNQEVGKEAFDALVEIDNRKSSAYLLMADVLR